ncbi:hypothetical protein GGQ99_001332 [Aminobacter niigataensis]|uniref:Uncharacterized protein n=1 Tax=Aminobacter niigataensis TaxID=83265 RepID=A0ABR6KYJ8_9HYPH|nr:hypothetical protein [Aminobacter niigataensis]MBB4649610.1 hypothetical protein [Aminobacter niigataensis]
MSTRINPLLTDTEHFIFAGEDIDARVTYSRREADGYAKDLNSDRTDFSVIRFNVVEGTCRDVTDEFLADEAEDAFGIPSPAGLRRWHEGRVL